MYNIKRKTTKNVLPGFGLTLGFSILYLSLLVLIPVCMLVIHAGSMGFARFIGVITDPRVVQSYWLSIYTSFIAASVNAIIGLIAAWTLVRYDFPGKKFLNAIVDLPFALPTAVAGISLAMLFSPAGWAGHYFEKINLQVINTPIGIIAALIFIGFPFVVRTVQPVLEELEPEVEEAAACLGANRFLIFIHVIFPNIIPALLTGFTLAFARSLGEYGSVIFISGNLPFKTEIAPLLIIAKLDQFDFAGASAIAVTLLTISFVILLILNLIQKRQSQKLGEG